MPVCSGQIVHTILVCVETALIVQLFAEALPNASTAKSPRRLEAACLVRSPYIICTSTPSLFMSAQAVHQLKQRWRTTDVCSHAEMLEGRRRVLVPGRKWKCARRAQATAWLRRHTYTHTYWRQLRLVTHNCVLERPLGGKEHHMPRGNRVRNATLPKHAAHARFWRCQEVRASSPAATASQPRPSVIHIITAVSCGPENATDVAHRISRRGVAVRAGTRAKSRARRYPSTVLPAQAQPGAVRHPQAQA